MSYSSPRNLRFIVLSCLTGFWLAACGQASDAPEAQVSRNTPAVTADGKFILRRGNGAEPETLDPHRAQSMTAANIIRDLYEGLMSAHPNGQLMPGAADKVQVSADGRRYVFHLRENAQWSNGEPVTAADFVYGMRRCVDPKTASAYAEILKPIENAEAIIAGKLSPEQLGVVAVGSYELEIRLKAPTPYFLGLLAHPSAFPVHRATVELHGEQFSRPGNSVTNGAYQIGEWVTASHITLERNHHYWNDAQTRIDVVRYLPIENADSEYKRYLAGELDWTGSVPISQLDWVKKHLPDDYSAFPTLGIYYFGFNTARPPFNDARLRRALTLAVDRSILTEKVTRGGEIPAYAWVPPGLSDYTQQLPEWANRTQAQREDEAKKLYADAGYSKDHPLTVEFRYNTSEGHKKIALAVAWMWKKTLGVQVRLINEEWKVFLQNVQMKKLTEVYRMGWFGDYDDANTFLELMHSGFGLNGTGYANAAYDDLLTQASMEPDVRRRRELLQTAERQLLSDLPGLPLYHYVSKHLMKPYVKGYVGNVLDHHYSKDLWIERPNSEGTTTEGLPPAEARSP